MMSSPVAQFRKSPSLVSIVRGAQGFAAALEEALRLDTAERRKGRQFVRQHGSDVRLSAALERVTESLRVNANLEIRQDAAARIEGHYPNGFFAVAR
jgi:hypothetical protein